MKPTPYGKGSRREKKAFLGRDELIDTMRYLGYVTHDQEGKLYPDIAAVASRMAGKYVENVMLGADIATEISKERGK